MSARMYPEIAYLERKENMPFYAGVDIRALPQIRLDSRSPKLHQSRICVGGMNHVENKRFPGMMRAI